MSLSKLSDAFTIGVVGNGTVGSATAKCYSEWFKIFVYDTNSKRSLHTLEETLKADVIFLCLPEIELNGFIKGILKNPVYNPTTVREDCNFVIRSTVKIGTTRSLKERHKLRSIVHSPEFLTERCAFVDAQIPSRNVIGGDYCNAKERLRELYQFRFPGTVLILMNTAEESEAVKLFTNGFFATKISYFNEIEKLADANGWNWQRIVNAILADGRITRSHTQVPGPDGMFGYGGRCLPKDLEYLIEALGSDAIVTQAAKYYARHRDVTTSSCAENLAAAPQVAELLPTTNPGT